VCWFGLSFGPSIGGIIGNPLPNLFFQGVGQTAVLANHTVSIIRFISSKIRNYTCINYWGFAERIRFWALFIHGSIHYDLCTLCHMTWHPKDYSSRWGSGFWRDCSTYECWLGGISWQCFLGKRKLKINPARITYVLLGTGLLWFGWFGFNAGSALGANGIAVQALGTTTVAAAAAGMAWVF
jgi:Amt family ammonium transporter